MKGITLLGLGPGNPEQLTLQAWNWLQRIPLLYIRTSHHSVVAGFPDGLEVVSFDDIYDSAEDYQSVYSQIVEKILALGQSSDGVTYAVPGHPFVAEATCPEIYRRAADIGLPVQIIEGVSFLEPTFSALQIDPFPQLALVDALDLAMLHTPSFPPSSPALIAQIYSRQVAADVKITLNAVYPDHHPVRLVHAAGTPAEEVEDLCLYEIDRSSKLGLLSSLYVPELGQDCSVESFQEVVAHLRAPDGCPWDREQTHLTLRNNLLEETYEALEALDAENMAGLREELGDLLLQIVLHAQIASEEGEFSLADVVQGINQKIIRRHPHVFGDIRVANVTAVIQNWEKIKQEERQHNQAPGNKGSLDGIPTTLPALAQAQAVYDRAFRTGLRPAVGQEILSDLRDCVDRIDRSKEPYQRERILGRMLSLCVSLAYGMKVDAESVPRETISQFRRRFAAMEQLALERGWHLADLPEANRDALWAEAVSTIEDDSAEI